MARALGSDDGMRYLFGIVCLALAACASDDRHQPVTERPETLAGVARANTEIARDFLDLSFRLESGRHLPVLSRFEGPVTVKLVPPAPRLASDDLDALLVRLRAEAGVDLHRVNGAAAITISFVPHAQITEAMPEVACFVVPGVSDWAGYLAARGTRRLDWSRLGQRQRIAVFLPSDSTPQEVRDCLHEELAQAIGPLNDLYRLPDSILNDDNFHNTLTDFDMLVLRIYTGPELRSGMRRSEVAALLPELLRALNPAGESAPPAHSGGGEPQAWHSAISRATDRQNPVAQRRSAAAHALRIAKAEGWKDGRLAFSLFLNGRLLVGRDPKAAWDNLLDARKIYARLPEAQIHAAHVDMQLAAIALAADALSLAAEIADGAIPVARDAGNSALLATLILIKAEALDRGGQHQAAEALRLDSAGPARYGFGDDAAAELLQDVAVIGRRNSATVSPSQDTRSGQEEE